MEHAYVKFAHDPRDEYAATVKHLGDNGWEVSIAEVGSAETMWVSRVEDVARGLIFGSTDVDPADLVLSVTFVSHVDYWKDPDGKEYTWMGEPPFYIPKTPEAD